MVAPITIGGGITFGGGISVGNPSTPPSSTTWGITALDPNTYNFAGSAPSGSGSAGAANLVIDLTGFTSNSSILEAYPIGTVFTILAGTFIGTGETFTLTSQFTAGPTANKWQATTVYAGAGFFPGSASMSQLSVS